MLKRRWIRWSLGIGTGLLALGLAAAFWAKRSPWLSARLQAPIQAALAQASGRPVSLGGVGGGLSGWIWLQDVGVGPDPAGRAVDLSVSAKAIGLRFRLLDLARGRTGLENLQALRVDEPSFYLLRQGVPALQSPSAKSATDWRQALQGFPLPSVRMDLRDGRAFEQLQGQAPRSLATSLRVGLEPSEKGWRLRGQVELESGGRVALWGQAERDMGAAELKARASGIRVASWAAWAGLPDGLSVGDGTLSGEMDLRQDPGRRWQLGGRGEVRGLGLQWKGREALNQGAARWAWDGQSLALSALHGRGAGGRLEGRLQWRPGQGMVGRVGLKRADLGALAALLGAPSGLQLSGGADLELGAAPAGASATAWALELKGREAAWAGRPLSRLELVARDEAGRRSADLDLAWPGGQGGGKLEGDAAGLNAADLRVEGLPADWIGAFNGLTLSGSLDGRWSYKAAGAAHPWELDLKSAALSVQGLALQGLHLSGSGGSKQLNLRLEGGLEHWKGLNASLEAAASGDAWVLRRLKLFEKDKLRAEAQGRWSRGKAELELLRSDLPLAPLKPWLPEALRGLSGTVRAQGALSWDGKAAGMDLGLDASLQAQGQALPISARLKAAPGGIQISALDLRKGELKGSAQAQVWGGPWIAELALQRAQLGAWAALLGSPGGISGTASGRVALKGVDWEAKVQVQEPWPDALPKAVMDLDISTASGRWELQRLHLKQGAGQLSAQGSLDLRGPVAWNGEARWQGLRLNGAAFEGQAALEPIAGGGLLRVSPWSLSKTALPFLRAELKPSAGSLRSVDAWLGERSSVKLRRQGGAWTARLNMEQQDPAELLGPWLGTAQPSGLGLNGWAELALPAGGPAQWSLDLADAGVPGSRLQASGAARLQEARFSGWDLGRVAPALKRLGLADLPVSAGLLEGAVSAQAGGLSLSAKAQGLKALGADLGPAELQGWSDGKRWSLARLDAGGSGPQLRLREWSGLSGAAWSAEGGLELEQWPAAIFILAGQGRLKLKGAGGRLSGESRWEELRIGERLYQDLGLRFAYEDGHISVAEAGKPSAFKAEALIQGGDFELSDLQAAAGKGKAWLKGRVGKDGAMAFEGQAGAFPAQELTGWLGWPQEWSGAAYGNLVLGGSLSATTGVISVKIEAGSVAGLPFDLATGLVHLEPGWVQLSPLRPIRLSRANGVALEVQGKVPLGGEGSAVPVGLDVSAELKGGGLGLMAGLPPISSAEGALELSLRFEGRRDDPQVSGRLRVQDGKLTPAWLLPPLEHLELFAQIENGQLILHKAEAQVAGDGPLLKIENADPKRAAFVFERWLPSAMNLRLRASKSGLPLRSTPALRFVDGQAHPDLRLGGSWDAPVLEGSLRLDKGLSDKAVVQWPPQWAKRSGPASEGGFFDALRYELRLIARQDVLVRTEAAQVFVDSGEEGLLLLGGGEERDLEGRLRFTRGSIDYLLASFQLATDKETHIDFRRGSPPELELWGLKRVRDALLQNESVRRDVDVRLHAFGPLGEVQMRLESEDPNLTQQQLASLAGLGIDVSDPRSQGGFARMLGKVPGRFLTSLMRRSGMVDEVGVRLPAVEDALSGPGRTPVPGEAPDQPAASTGTGRTLLAIDAGKYLGEKLYVGVSGLLQERPGEAQGSNTVDPALGGKVEYQMKDSTRLSAQHNVDTAGQSEQRLMLERSARFENYNPRKRRWDQMTPTPGPVRARKTPQPKPSPSPTRVP